MKKVLYFLILFTSGVFFSYGQSFVDQEKLTSTLKKLNHSYTGITRLESIARSPGGKEVWALTIGTGDVDHHPGIAIVTGVDGAYISGTSITLKIIENILISSQTDSIRNLLDSVSFYFFPNMNPDASEQYFSQVKYERSGNERATDDDRDGRINEDPYEDLNEDRMITQLRIKDPTGEWILHPSDERIMIRADKKKGEKGEYLLISEGVDNDLDQQFNEDGPGGIDFNKNLTFQYVHFSPGSGEFPVSEPESRGLLDFLYQRWNIFCVFTLGPASNLSKPMAYDESRATAEIVTGIQEKDAVLNAMVSDKYNEITGKKDHAEVKTFEGGFMQWAYFHYGRQSYGTPAFFIPDITIKKDSVETDQDVPEEFNPEVNFLKWADSLLAEPVFLNWSRIEHPDFPGKEVEIGGIHPFKMKNPPPGMIDSLAETHGRFLVWLASLRPELEVLNLKTTGLGNQVYRLELDVYNTGIFPAMSGIGEKTRWVKKPKISLGLQADQALLSGKKITLLDQLEGDSKVHLSWLIQGKGTISLETGAPQTGITQQLIDLK
jgi:hypothetical protein